MNKAQKRPILHKVLSMILALVMVLSLMPLSALAETTDTSNSTGEFMRIFHLDCGRKYFTVDQINELIDCAAENNYTHVELAFGNDGLRFLLDDMSVGDYASEKVKAAIQNGNKAFYDAGDKNELTETEMSEIIAHANSKNIGIIPMFDAPGHLQAVIRAMQTLGFSMSEGSRYSVPTTSGTSANWAINPTYTEGLNFVQTLVQKYIDYFAGKGCKYFNIAADECGFASMSSDKYTAYANFVNAMAKNIKDAEMIPIAFSDGFGYKGLTLNNGVEFDKSIKLCYWTAGDNYADAATLAESFDIINANNHWYYVIGKEKTTGTNWSDYAYHHDYAVENMSKSGSCLQVDGDTNGAVTPVGCMAAIWCDNPGATVNWANVKSYIAALKSGNPDYFKAAPVTTITSTADTLIVDGTATLSLSNGEGATWSVEPADVVSLSVDGTKSVTGTSVTVTALKAGTATITATTTDGKTYTYPLTVQSADELEQKTITVQAGKEYPVTVDGYVGNNGETVQIDEHASYTIKHNTETVSGDPEKAATLESGEYIIGNGTRWIVLNGTSISSTDDPSQATKWTVTKSGSSYTIKNGDYYLVHTNNRLSANTSLNNNAWNWSSTNGFYYTLESGNRVQTYYLYSYSNYNGSYSWSVSRNTNERANPYTLKPATEANTTTITFRGLEAGDSQYVTIGNVRYKVHVTAEDLTGKYLPIQTWITNNGIQIDNVTTSTTGSFSNSRYAYYAKIDAAKAYGENGTPLSELIPASVSGLKEWGNVYWDEAAQNRGSVIIPTNTTETVDDFATRKSWTLDLLKGTCLSSGHYQINLGDNQFAAGNDFQFVRYYQSSWWVSADRKDWKEVTAGDATTVSTTSVSASKGTQIVAYYMARTEITKEVTTDVIDWGEAKPKSETGVILDFAVKYPDGTQVPTAFPVENKTMFFNMLKSSDTSRRLYDIKALEESGYEVYMITVTPSSDKQSDKITMNENTSPTYKYEGTEKVAWVDDENNLPSEFRSADKKYTSISKAITYSVGGDPSIKGVEIYSQQAMLVTYYIRAKVTADSLTVHYIDKTANKEFYYYNISVISPTTFNENIALNVSTWKGPLAKGTVINDQGVTQTVSADLSTMPKIGAQYRYSDYECVEVTHSDDFKEVFLYYTFTAKKTFVVDFGLPLTIKPSDVSENLQNANITDVVVDNSYYADITVGSDHAMTYKLRETINGSDKVTVTYKGMNLSTAEGGSATFNLTIIPASTVYYEDSFATFTSGTGAAEDAKWQEVKDGTNQTVTNQALSALGDKAIYGYDEAYKNSTKYSMGSAHKVTVNAEMAKNWSSDSTSAWPTATFTFKGTGFDIISLTNSDAGAIMYTVTNKKTQESFSRFINNYYGYEYKDGQWTITNDKGAIYQVPIIKVSDLDYGTYEVEISVRYGEFFDENNDGTYSFWLDAIRVYNPMGKNYSDYAKDNEVSPDYVEVKKVILDTDALGKENATGAVFIDGKGSTDVSEADYNNFGPNHEAYLANSQAIAFQLVANGKPTSVQLGAKLAQGESAALTITGAACNKADNGVLTLKTATDMYYELTDINWEIQSDGTYKSGVITLTNKNSDADPIISLTNIKFIGAKYTSAIADVQNASDKILVTFAASPAMVSEAVNAVSNVLSSVSEPFAPERFEAEWNSVRAGRQATLTVKTSTDVESITVNGVTVDSYKTRYERSGWGWWAQKVEYREFSYTVKATETADYDVCAVNADGVASEPITATLTVKPTQNSWWNNWWNGIFDKWF